MYWVGQNEERYSPANNLHTAQPDIKQTTKKSIESQQNLSNAPKLAKQHVNVESKHKTHEQEKWSVVDCPYRVASCTARCGDNCQAMLQQSIHTLGAIVFRLQPSTPSSSEITRKREKRDVDLELCGELLLWASSKHPHNVTCGHTGADTERQTPTHTHTHTRARARAENRLKLTFEGQLRRR